MLEEGTAAPDFRLNDAEGKEHTLAEFSGKKIVLYFYPKDDTPGCTKEACGFRDSNASITAKGAVVIGISADPVESHGRFAKKYGLPFLLLSDPQRRCHKAYGALRLTGFGATLAPARRCTFIIDEMGVIVKVFPDVTPEGHAEEVLKALG